MELTAFMVLSMIFGEKKLPPVFCFIGEGAGLHERLGGNCNKNVVGDGEIGTLCLLLRILKHDDVLGDSRCLGIVEPHIYLEVDHIKSVEATTMLLKMGEEGAGLDTYIEGCSML